MSVKRTLTLISRDTNGDVIQRNIANANPNAADEDLDTFLRSLNGLSTNTYVDGHVVEEYSLNERLSE